MRRLLTVLALLFAVTGSAVAGEYGAVGASYRVAGIPDFVVGSAFQDYQSIMAHSGMIEYSLDSSGAGWRFGLLFTQFDISDGYWRVPETRVDQAVFAEFPLGVVAVTAGYSWRFTLADGLHLVPTAGIGFGYVFGDIFATELIPGCEGPLQSCGHWREVTRHEVTLTSRILPIVNVSAALHWELIQGSSVAIELGVMNLPFAGIGFQQALDF